MATAWLLAVLLPLIHAACVTDESLQGSYHFPLLELDAEVTQPANFLEHQHGVATVHRTNATEVLSVGQRCFIIVSDSCFRRPVPRVSAM